MCLTESVAGERPYSERKHGGHRLVVRDQQIGAGVVRLLGGTSRGLKENPVRPGRSSLLLLLGRGLQQDKTGYQFVYPPLDSMLQTDQAGL